MQRKPLNNALRRAKRGFTLIELMVVIVILGILGTAGLFVYQGAIGDSEYGRAGAELSSIGNGANLYKTKHRKWPESMETLAQMSDGSSFSESDPWGTPYEIRIIEGAFEVRSAGVDGTLDTADDIFWRSNAKPPLYDPNSDEDSEMNQNKGTGGGQDI